MKQKVDNSKKIRAISLHQPWAGAIALGIKTLETRPWATQVRGDLLICSTKKKVSELELPANYELIYKNCSKEDKDILELQGHAICIVEVVDCVGTNDPSFAKRTSKQTKNDFLWGNYNRDRYVWVTRNMRRVKPVPVRGAQGFYFVEKKLIKEA